MPELCVIRAAQKGDLAAMSRLLEELAGPVGRICGAIALDDGPDAAQETLVQIFRDLPALRDPLRLRGWVRRIATREAIRHARRAMREPPTGASPSAADIALDQTTEIRTVLEALPPEQRAILVLRDLEGFTEQEAAENATGSHGPVDSAVTETGPAAFTTCIGAGRRVVHIQN